MPEGLVFIANTAQHAAARALLSDGAVPATYDHDLLFEFRQSAAPHVDLWSYLDPASAIANVDRGYALCDALGTLSEGTVADARINLAERCQDDAAFPFIYALNTETAVSRCLADHAPSLVHIFSEHETAFCWDPPDPPPDVFNAVARWCAEQAGRPVHLLSLGASKMTSAAPKPAASRYSAYEGAARAAGLNYASDIGIGERAAIAESATFRGRGWFKLGEDGNCGALNIRHCWNLPYRACREGAVDARRVREHLARAPDAPPCLVQNPHVEFLHAYIASLVTAADIHFQAGRFLARATGATIALLGYPVRGSVRCFREGLARGGCRTMSINHSGLSRHSVWRRHRGDRGELVVWGEWEKRVLEEIRASRDPVHAVGSFRRDIEAMMCEPARPFDPNARPVTIVILTSRCTHFYNGTIDVPGHWRLWDDVLAFIRRHPEWNFVLKPHPRYDHHRTYQSAAFRACPNLALFSGTVHEALQDAAVAVAINTMTTACLEPLARDIPLISIENAVHPSERGQLQGGAIALTEVGQLEIALQRMLADAHTRQCQVVAGREFLEQVVKSTGERAVEAIMKNVDASPAVPAADAASAWALDFLIAANNLMCGAPLEDARRHMEDLRAAWSAVSDASAGPVDFQRFGESLMNIVLWEPWPVYDGDGELNAADALHLVNDTLPKALRPAGRTFRKLMAEAELADGKRAAASGRALRRERRMPVFFSPRRALAVLKRKVVRDGNHA